ncbi:MAG TPA: nucleotidyltransferase family protein [Thermoanaerobaculia bacterium]|nr:nucleotidyltransferase family protein [Thermoanaerobaculia bacterium]
MDFVAETPIPERLREPLRAALRGERSDWPDLTTDELQTLVEHGVAPLVYAATHLPQLRDEAIRAAAVEPLRAADLREVLAALAANGVDALVMKGSALAYDVYASPELRPRGDTDLLIAASDIAPMRETMRALGFEERLSSGDEHGVRQAIFVRRALVYDVHWSATNTPVFDALLRFDDLRRRAMTLPALGARVLSHEDALLLACVHRVAHHHDSDRLIWLADIALLRDRMSRDEHARFWRMAAEGWVVAVCRRSIELANEWFSRPPAHLPEEWLTAQELARAEPSRVFLDREITHGRVLMANLQALGWRARFRRLRQLAFPPAEFMRHSFGRRPLPLLYAWRALRGVRRLFRKV